MEGRSERFAQRRVEKLNAHQLCLLTTIGTRASEDDFWSPKPRPVDVENLVHVRDDNSVYVPDTILPEVPESAPSPPNTNTRFQRSLFNVPLEMVDRSFDMFEQLLSGPPVATRSAHLILLAADHYHRWRFDQALIAAWTAAEALLAVLWGRYVDQSSTTQEPNGYVVGSRRRARLDRVPTATVAEILALAGIIDQQLFDELARGRSARNKWIHGLAPVAHESASSGVCSAERLLELTTNVQVAAPLMLSSAGLPD